MPPIPPRLLDQVRDRIRFKHYSLRTEQAYLDWIRRYIRFSGNCHPSALSTVDVERFLTHLAAEEGVAQSTQNQAHSAILFLYREVLGRDVRWLANVPRAKAPATLPVVLTPAEVGRLLRAIGGTHRLFGGLLYGTGMRILEAARLRVKDVDLARREIAVRDGKGAKDRVTVLPDRLAPALRRHLAAVRALHQADVERGHGSVWLPFALERKYPGASREWAWQYVFPADRLSIDPGNGALRRHHVSEQSFQRAMRRRSRGTDPKRIVFQPRDRPQSRSACSIARVPKRAFERARQRITSCDALPVPCRGDRRAHPPRTSKWPTGPFRYPLLRLPRAAATMPTP